MRKSYNKILVVKNKLVRIRKEKKLIKIYKLEKN